MRLRSLVLALVLASGSASAAGKHPKPPKAVKHVTASKGVKHAKSARKSVVHKPAKHARPVKAAKRKGSKLKKHKA
jgi:hypothetical protein